MIPQADARDDYPKLHRAHFGPSHQGQTSQEAQAALDEIDRLRAELAKWHAAAATVVSL